LDLLLSFLSKERNIYSEGDVLRKRPEEKGIMSGEGKGIQTRVVGSTCIWTSEYVSSGGDSMRKGSSRKKRFWKTQTEDDGSISCRASRVRPEGGALYRKRKTQKK